MKLSRRWKAGLLIGAWIAAVAVMVRYAYPNSFRRASEFGQWQHEMNRQSAARKSQAHQAADPAPAPAADSQH